MCETRAFLPARARLQSYFGIDALRFKTCEEFIFFRPPDETTQAERRRCLAETKNIAADHAMHAMRRAFDVGDATMIKGLSEWFLRNL